MRRHAPRAAARVLLVLAALILFLNVAIAGTSLLLGRSASAAEGLPGVPKFTDVDDRVVRGAAPSMRGYEALAAAGVRTVVDLRAEDDLPDVSDRLAELGMRLVRLPVRDGQLPTEAQIERFLAEVAGTEGRTFVHCGAGVGRTGAMVGAYLVRTGGDSPAGALRRNLAVGPPSLEQIAFVAGLGEDTARPSVVVTALSRVLDAPRRAWSRYGA